MELIKKCMIILTLRKTAVSSQNVGKISCYGCWTKAVNLYKFSEIIFHWASTFQYFSAIVYLCNNGFKVPIIFDFPVCETYNRSNSVFGSVSMLDVLLQHISLLYNGPENLRVLKAPTCLHSRKLCRIHIGRGQSRLGSSSHIHSPWIDLSSNF